MNAIKNIEIPSNEILQNKQKKMSENQKKSKIINIHWRETEFNILAFCMNLPAADIESNWVIVGPAQTNKWMMKRTNVFIVFFFPSFLSLNFDLDDFLVRFLFGRYFSFFSNLVWLLFLFIQLFVVCG